MYPDGRVRRDDQSSSSFQQIQDEYCSKMDPPNPKCDTVNDSATYGLCIPLPFPDSRIKSMSMRMINDEQIANLVVRRLNRPGMFQRIRARLTEENINRVGKRFVEIYTNMEIQKKFPGRPKLSLPPLEVWV